VPRDPACQPRIPAPAELAPELAKARAAAPGACGARGRAFYGLGRQARAVRAQEREHVRVAVPNRVQRGRAAVAVHRVHTRAMAWRAAWRLDDILVVVCDILAALGPHDTTCEAEGIRDAPHAPYAPK